VKVPLYARAGVPEVWLVDLVVEAVEALHDPAGDRYRIARVARRGEHLTVGALPDVTLAVADIFG